MSGERDLKVLLASMRPVLVAGEYVYCSTDEVPAGLEPVVLVREPEGVTVVVRRERHCFEQRDCRQFAFGIGDGALEVFDCGGTVVNHGKFVGDAVVFECALGEAHVIGVIFDEQYGFVFHVIRKAG